jgi:hypothetical protein
MSLEKEIKNDVRKWSEHFLEIPNKHLGGFPACPFAKKTWKDDKVVVEVKRKHKWYKAELNAQLKQLDFSVHEILIFCDPYFNYSLEDFQETIDAYNTWYNKKDIYFMGFHPHNPANEEELAQKFSQLQEASDKLHRIGYYKLWPTGYYKDVVVSRQKTYKRIFGGQYEG